MQHLIELIQGSGIEIHDEFDKNNKPHQIMRDPISIFRGDGCVEGGN